MIRKWAAELSIGLGTIWTWAGVAKMIFGVRITLPIFPAVDLTRVDATPAVLIGLGLVVLGAWLKRGVDLHHGRLPATLAESRVDEALGPGPMQADAGRPQARAFAEQRGRGTSDSSGAAR